MTRFITKIVGGLTLSALIGSILVPSALANGEDLEIHGNGVGSTNTINASSTSNTSVVQENVTLAEVIVGASANTGDNEIKKTTGGSSKIDTGGATAKVKVTVEGGDNEATVDPCDCPLPSPSAGIHHNGALSKNTINWTAKSHLKVDQGSLTVAGVLAGADANTGDNEIKKSTGGSATILTGNAKAKVRVRVSGGSNTLNP